VFLTGQSASEHHAAPDLARSHTAPARFRRYFRKETNAMASKNSELHASIITGSCETAARLSRARRPEPAQARGEVVAKILIELATLWCSINLPRGDGLSESASDQIPQRREMTRCARADIGT
jgi:hypothetical protein